MNLPVITMTTNSDLLSLFLRFFNIFDREDGVFLQKSGQRVNQGPGR